MWFGDDYIVPHRLERVLPTGEMCSSSTFGKIALASTTGMILANSPPGGLDRSRRVLRIHCDRYRRTTRHRRRHFQARRRVSVSALARRRIARQQRVALRSLGPTGRIRPARATTRCALAASKIQNPRAHISSSHQRAESSRHIPPSLSLSKTSATGRLARYPPSPIRSA